MHAQRSPDRHHADDRWTTCAPGTYTVQLQLADVSAHQDHRARGRWRACARGRLPGQRTGAAMIAVLALRRWHLVHQGCRPGRPGETTGEVVFNTSMTGYQEVLTDPSYAGQIVTMTAPQIGNYGVAQRRPGVGVRRRWPASSCATRRRFRATGGRRARCATTCTQHGIVAIGDIDTRALTRKLRSGGVMRGVIATGSHGSAGAGREGARGAADGRRRPGEDRHLRGALRLHDDAGRRRDRGGVRRAAAASGPRGRCGWRPTTTASSSTSCAGWPRTAARSACSRRTRPATEVLAWEPDGVFLSNGPGDPAAVTYAVDNIKTLIDAGVPMFGICLGHQLMALGARREDLQAEVRASRRQPSGEAARHRRDRDHRAEPRVRRRPGDRCRTPRG